jgi:hypothetical protein
VRKFVGAINGQSKFVTETFDNGYIFAWLIVLDTTINCPTFVNTFLFYYVPINCTRSSL